MQAVQLWRRALRVASRLSDPEAEGRITERLEQLGPVDAAPDVSLEDEADDAEAVDEGEPDPADD